MVEKEMLAVYVCSPSSGHVSIKEQAVMICIVKHGNDAFLPGKQMVALMMPYSMPLATSSVSIDLHQPPEDEDAAASC